MISYTNNDNNPIYPIYREFNENNIEIFAKLTLLKKKENSRKNELLKNKENSRKNELLKNKEKCEKKEDLRKNFFLKNINIIISSPILLFLLYILRKIFLNYEKSSKAGYEVYLKNRELDEVLNLYNKILYDEILPKKKADLKKNNEHNDQLTIKEFGESSEENKNVIISFAKNNMLDFEKIKKIILKEKEKILEGNFETSLPKENVEYFNEKFKEVLQKIYEDMNYIESLTKDKL